MPASPQILSAALFERDARVLTAHRKTDRRPFAGQWLLPLTPVHPSETAEDAVKRYAREQFGVEVAREAFVDTVYMQDPDDSAQYVTNIFRAELRGGPMRFRADGDYDDARWLAAAEVEQLWMPPALRAPLVRILTEPDYLPETGWGAPPQEALPLGERAAAGAEGEETPVDEAPPPDNRAGWDAIAAAYQQEHARYDAARLRWTRGVYEDELRVLDDVSGKRAIVLGCGDGRDVVALALMGAVAVGVDFVPAQLAAARKLATKHHADNASFIEADVGDLSRFDDASFDLAVSIHALDFVEDAGAVLAGCARILAPGAVLAVAVLHPWNQIFSNDRPYPVVRSYWTERVDFNWDDEKFGDEGRLRVFRRTIGQWIDLLHAAGFALERLIEPRQDAIDDGEADAYDMERAALMPQVLIIKARKR